MSIYLLLILSLVIHDVIASITCVGEGRVVKTLPDSYINDDYCDCVQTGEDEFLTSACAGVHNLFRCKENIDRKNISSSFVKDKICDCCDGSDEDIGVCTNTCAEDNRALIKKIEEEIDLHTEGEVSKKAYIKQGNHGVKQIEGTKKQLRKEIQLEEQELQSKIHSQNHHKVVLQQLYMETKQKQEQLQVLERLSSMHNAFGSKREFFSLFGKCFRKQSNEKQFKGGTFENIAKDFVFEVCPFARISQKGTELDAKTTILGYFQKWDEDQENVMVYSGGDECWNGPNRIVHLKMVCGRGEDELKEVRENGKCTYEFTFSSPAACNKKHADKMKKYLKQIAPESEKPINHHDEL